MHKVYGVMLAGLIGWPLSANAQTLKSELIRVDLKERRIQIVATHPTHQHQVFAATKDTFYESKDDGASWQELFHVPGAAQATALAIDGSDESAILLGTTQGLWASFDDGQQWTHAFRGIGEAEASVTHVAFHPARPGVVLMATRDGLFMSADHGRHWTAAMIPLSARPVVHFAFDPQDAARLYLITTSAVFTGNFGTGQWEQRLTVFQATEPSEEDTPQGETDALEAEEPPPMLSAIAVDPQHPSTLYVAGSRGLETSPDGGGSWRRITQIGLRSPSIARLLPHTHSPFVLYAATARGLARYEPARDRWTALAIGSAITQVNDLAAGAGYLWAATDQGLFRYEITGDAFPETEPPTARELLDNFVHEPTMAQVREAAIRYAEVHPDKIKWWRRQAALQALLPSVDIGLDHDRSRDAHYDEGSFPSFQVIQTMDRAVGFDISATWDLGELIWNDDQTSIDVRSKLMVQLRDDIVDEVTRAYFERRRLQIALLTNPPADQQASLDKELRLQELTGMLDGLTGGYFSQHLHVTDTP